MNWLNQLSARHRRYDDLSAAIREHLDEKIADFMERRMTRDEADKAARRESGRSASPDARV